MKYCIVTFLLLFFTVCLFAQGKVSYADQAAQLQKEIWDNPTPEFTLTQIPKGMEKESAVVLARSFKYQQISKDKVVFLVLAGGIMVHTLKTNTLHERVKILDKAALESFSKLEYKKRNDKSVHLLIANFQNKFNTFIGIKIIKPDGKLILVSPTEEVLTKNETKDQEGKLAVPSLEVGDIMDYYVSTTEINDANSDQNSFSENNKVFIFADAYPVLNYSINLLYAKKIKVKTIYANGAPHFTENHNDAGDLLLSLKLTNLQRLKSQLWVSNLRQLPYAEVGSSFSWVSGLSSGEQKDATPHSLFDYNRAGFESMFHEEHGFDWNEKQVKEYFKSNRAFKQASLDSVMRVLFNEVKYDTFDLYYGDDLAKISTLNYRLVDTKKISAMLCLILTEMKIDHDVLMVASRNGKSLENIFGSDDFDAAIRINSVKPIYLFFDGPMTSFNEIPARFEGEKAIIMHPKRVRAGKYTFTYNDTYLPTSTSIQNNFDETLQVNLLPEESKKLLINRTVNLIGALRFDYQQLLIPALDVDRALAKSVGGDELGKRLKDTYQSNNKAKEYTFAFQKDAEETKNRFITELNDNYSTEPDQLKDYKIIDEGLAYSSPAFKFSESFTLNNLVQKAGDNYIIDAGKLTGNFLTIDENKKTRDIDVYMPEARSFTYTISIAVPPGFEAKGLEEMTLNKTNKTGSFTSSATLQGSNVVIKVSKVFNHNFEKAADWPLLLDLIQTGSSFNDLKLLFEKKG